MARGYAIIIVSLLCALVRATAHNNLPRDVLLPRLTGRNGQPSPKTDAAVALDILRRESRCPAGSLLCLDGSGCCKFACCGSGCCLAGELCYDDKGPAVCCRAYLEKKCTAGCIPMSASCCGNGQFCEYGTKCVRGGCCKWGHTCTGDAGPPTQYTRTRDTHRPTPPPETTSRPPALLKYSDSPARPTDTEESTTDYVPPPMTFPDSSSEALPTETSSSSSSSTWEVTFPTFSEPSALPSGPPTAQSFPGPSIGVANLNGVGIGGLAAAAGLAVGVLGAF